MRKQNVLRQKLTSIFEWNAKDGSILKTKSARTND